MIMAIEHSGIDIKTDATEAKLLDMQLGGSSGNQSGGAFAGKASFKKNSRDGSIGNRNPSNDNSVGRKSLVICYRCKQPGHYKNKCPEIEKDKKSNAFSAVFLSGNFNRADWYIDLGASVHLTTREDWLKNKQQDSELTEIMVANKTKISVICQADIDITTVVGRDKHKVTIKKVLYVPELTTNLLSVSQLIKNGNKVIFEEKGCKVFNSQGTLVSNASLIDNVHRLNFQKSKQTLLAGTALTSEVWHRRFAHLNYKDLNLMNDGAVQGFEHKRKLENNQICEVCCEGKQARLPFKHKGNRATEVLDIVHGDLCGPMETAS